MKLIPWKFNNDMVEGYTVPAHIDGRLFNMSYNGLDDKQVLENRKELAQMLHTELDHMVAPLQRHTTHYLSVNKNDGGKGIYSQKDAYLGFDALYTRDTDLTLFTFHADCCPVLLYCENQHLVAAIHSGWKGTVTEIVGKVTRHLIEDEGCDPNHIYAYVGPSIEARNFEAMDDIIDRVKSMSFDTSSFYTKKDETHYLLNSKGLIKQQLLNCGVLEEHIEVSPYCTMENDDLFFSYRKTHTKDRNISMIRLKK